MRGLRQEEREASLCSWEFDTTRFKILILFIYSKSGHFFFFEEEELSLLSG